MITVLNKKVNITQSAKYTMYFFVAFVVIATSVVTPFAGLQTSHEGVIVFSLTTGSTIQAFGGDGDAGGGDSGGDGDAGGGDSGGDGDAGGGDSGGDGDAGGGDSGGDGDAGGGDSGDDSGGDSGDGDPSPDVPGCTDPSALNYNPGADTDDGSCTYPAPNPQPSCYFTVSPSTIDKGESSKLFWTTQHANSVSINQGIGPVSLNNSAGLTVHPTYTITYKLTATGPGGSVDCLRTITVVEPAPAPTCTLALSPKTITLGESTHLVWTTQNASNVSINHGIGSVAANDSLYVSPTYTKTYTLTATGPGGTVTCNDMVTVNQPEPEAPVCTSFVGTPTSLPVGGGNVLLSWLIKNADLVTIDNGIGVVTSQSNKTVHVTDDTVFKLVATASGFDPVQCTVAIDVAEPQPDPISCAANVSFTANPTNLPVGGGNVTLTWTANDVDTIAINNGILAETATLSGTDVASVADDIVYTLTAKRGSETIQCPVSVNVAEPQPDAITCEANVSFTGTPNSLPVGGGDVELSWTTTDVTGVSIDHGIGSVSLNGTTSYAVSADTTFVLTAEGQGGPISCPFSVAVADAPGGISCDANVTFTADKTSLSSGGGDVVLTWSTTGIDTVSINGVASTNLSDSETVNVSSDWTYTLTASDGNQTINCPLSIDVESGGGGGGGGSSSPRCEFDASDTTIRAGEEVTLSWETSRGRELSIYEGDADDEKIFETDDDDQVDEGSIKVRPTRDTTYTLVVERGSRDRECEVDIDVEGGGVVISSSRVPGQVAGISLSAVPYTGFEAGPTLTILFYTLLTVWALFVAYMLVIREDTVLGFSLPGIFPKKKVLDSDVSTEEDSDLPEVSKAEAYVESVTPQQTRSTIPDNLPTNQIVGYQAAAQTALDAQQTKDDQSQMLKELEDRAHEKRVLLSSDAMRHLIASCPQSVNRLVFLDGIIAEAKISFPSEDGWMVLNLDRMQKLCDKRAKEMKAEFSGDKSSQKSIDITNVEMPDGVGSLAEAIASGNVVAAYQMIGSRPMLALADAAADFDAVYRGRKGEQVVVSDMLARETAKHETNQLEQAIAALTSALDGTYTTEESAVKMSIMKAIKALS